MQAKHLTHKIIKIIIKTRTAALTRTIPVDQLQISWLLRQNLFFFCYALFFKTVFLCVASRPDWSQTHRNPPASVSWVLRLKASTTTPHCALNVKMFLLLLLVYECLPEYMSVHLREVEESTRPLWAAMWILETELWSFTGASSALNHRAIRPSSPCWTVNGINFSSCPRKPQCC